MSDFIQLEYLQEKLQQLLAESLFAIYLYGSAVDGGLGPESDLDVLVVVTQPLTSALREQLAQELLKISQPVGELQRPLEVTILLKDEIQSGNYPLSYEMQFGEWLREELKEGGTLSSQKEIEKPLMAAAEDITREVAQEYQPGLWEGMPEFARQRLIRRVQSKAPEIVEHIMSEVQRDVNRYFDIKHLVISNLLKDKRLLNNIFKRVGKQEFKFFSNVGFVFGFGIGVIQMLCWIVTQGKYPWMLPLFGGFVGFFSDWIALQMMFRPLYPKKILGYTWQGLFIKRQNEVAADYAALISKQLLTSRHMMEELFSGTHSARVIELVNRHVKQEIDMQAGVIRPLVVYVIGGEKYQNMKTQVAERIMQQLPETMKYVESYAEDAMNIRNTLIERMQKLTPSEFEGMLRPAFKEDEWALIAVGAVLGFVVGELQIQFML